MCPHVRALEHTAAHLGNSDRQLHSAQFKALAGCDQTRLAKHIQRPLDLRAHHHFAVLETRLFFIDQTGVGSKRLHRHLQSEIKRRLQGFGAVFGVTIKPQQVFRLVQFE